MAPPGVIAYSTTGGKRSAEARNLRNERVKGAHAFSAFYGLGLSHSAVVRLVREYEHDIEPKGFGSLWDVLATRVQVTAERRREFATAHPELAYCLTYADPTGEGAT